MPTCHSYSRVSDKQQVEGDSLDAQDERLRHWYETHPVGDDHKPLREQGVEWGEVYRDEGESAFKKRFLQRQNAARLFQATAKGDHVVIDRLDRAFRNIGDCFNTIEAFQSRGVSVHLRDHPEIDFSTAMGRMIAGMLAIMAEWYSALLSERMREVADRRKTNGQPVNQKVPFGKKRNDVGRKKRFDDDPAEIALAARIVEMHDGGMSYKQVLEQLERDYCREHQCEFRPLSEFRKPLCGLTLSKVRWYAGKYRERRQQREGEEAA